MLAWIGAILIGVCLGLLGSGGSIITVPILVYLVGHGEKQAIAESLVIVGVIALVGVVRTMRSVGLDQRSVILFGLPGMAGAGGGAFIARWIPGEVQLVLLAVVMLAAAVLMVRRGGGAKAVAGVPRATWVRLSISGAAVGVLTGLVGVGGGFLIVPALVVLAGLPIHAAIGTSLAIIFLNCGTSFVGHHLALRAQSESEDWSTVALFVVLGVGGALAGQFVGRRVDRPLLSRIFAAFLVLMCAAILIQEAPRLL